MRLVFWQIIIDQLQLPYIVHLLDDKRVDEVVVVVGEKMIDGRKDMGWNTDFPGIEKCLVCYSPDEQTVRQIFSKRQSESIHLFTGIRGFECVYRNFLISLDYDIKRGFITERPLTYAYGVDWAKPMWMHKLRFLIQDRKYIPKIDYVFAIGEECCKYYKSISSRWKVFPFMYCTLDSPICQERNSSEDICRLVFVGSLSKRKSVITLLKVINRLKKNGYDGLFKLTIVGNGPERNNLESYVGENNLHEVEFLGTVNNKDLPKLLSQQDVLILPSIHDGWGAVINEALQTGVYAVCSNKCGAKEMLHSKELGRVFSNEQQLYKILKEIIPQISEVRMQADSRRMWAKKSISGNVIAQYMVDVLKGIDRIQPWGNLLNVKNEC